MAKKLDNQAVSAAIAGFLACHVLTCRFLIAEGSIDKERFAAYLENAIAEMTPGMDDQRAMFAVTQLLNGYARPHRWSAATPRTRPRDAEQSEFHIRGAPLVVVLQAVARRESEQVAYKPFGMSGALTCAFSWRHT
jgi:hypothetical protein